MPAAEPPKLSQQSATTRSRPWQMFTRLPGMFMIQSHYLKQLIIILGKELHSRIDAGLPKIMEMFHETRPWH